MNKLARSADVGIYDMASSRDPIATLFLLIHKARERLQVSQMNLRFSLFQLWREKISC